MTEKSYTSRKIGSTLAQLQTFMDDVFEFGFNKLKVFGAKKPAVKKPETLKEQAAQFAHTSAGFIGDVGAAYYATYQKLKAKKEKKNSKSV